MVIALPWIGGAAVAAGGEERDVKIGKRTAKLLREAIVLGYVEGAWREGGHKATIPADSDIVAGVLDSAKRNRDLYPTLSRVESETGADR